MISLIFTVKVSVERQYGQHPAVSDSISHPCSCTTTRRCSSERGMELCVGFQKFLKNGFLGSEGER